MLHEKYKKAIILLNMGGPNSPTEVPLFLRNMFNDPNILSIKSEKVRGFIGNFIVKKRSDKSSKIYEALGGSSPITPITFSLVKKLQTKDESNFYTYAMRYTPPYADMVLKEIKDMGITDLVLFSMYPQYSFTTSLSSFQDVLENLKILDYKPSIKVVDRYFDDPLYIECIVKEILKNLGKDDPKDFVLILSAHSIPVSVVKKGDNYEKECIASKEAIIKNLESKNIHFKDCILSYQSKIGPIKWLGPNTDATIKKHAKSKLIIYPLSFTIDNSETKYELSMQYQDLADELKVPSYRVCECLNDSDDFVELISHLTKKD
ncbi:ferrochelatase [Helicobacter sp. 11S02629-2]|uniref:ferrochelatase n=1 Tax=Helicobacter sp. 11S02629-2 TaxID=1476195 RepID=UPI000BA6BEB0|nr:ferrochelatase [Helicobacter sp. 11S02629-2]PAF43276.1 ferrochelatase [Helicobacter sp. 11S02629-2]